MRETGRFVVDESLYMYSLSAISGSGAGTDASDPGFLAGLFKKVPSSNGLLRVPIEISGSLGGSPLRIGQ
jgi:hypothetical protein